jgi:hypothetical protein
MEISKDTQAVIEALDNFTEGSLRKKNDITYLLEIGASYGFYEEIATFIFSGKVLWNLFKTIKKTTIDTQTLIGVQKEFQTTLEVIRELILKFKEYGDETYQKRLQNTYLEVTKGCILNIVDLCHDFGKLKEMQTKIKNGINEVGNT